jgi:TfoX/Sxy family transcriptional regulator of competence genes
MAYDERLAAGVRDLLAGDPDVREQRMFGGLAFLVAGAIAVAARGDGGLMVRVDPARTADLVATGEACPVEMRGREMRGWVVVEAGALRGRSQLARWVELGVARARALSEAG